MFVGTSKLLIFICILIYFLPLYWHPFSSTLMHTVLWCLLKGTMRILFATTGGSSLFSTTLYVLVLPARTLEPDEETWRT
jgi:hypothetical protein